VGSLTSWIFFIFGYVKDNVGWNNFPKFERLNQLGS